MDIWPWICELPSSDEWDESNPQLVFQLASSKPSRDKTSIQSIQLSAERIYGPNSDDSVAFSLRLLGFYGDNAETKTIWVSDTCPLSSDKPFLPLVLQLLQEIVSRSPTAHNSICPRRSRLHQKFKPELVSRIFDSHSPESVSSFFNLVFLTRLFWLCAFDAPSEVGSLYFHSLLTPNLETFTSKHALILRTFFISVGVDVELCFMRTLGYILAKWLILRELSVGLLQLLTPSPLPSQSLGFSYATESRGLWVLKGYAPVWGMTPTRFNGQQKNQFEAKESVLRYALAHQQLEALVQLEYSIKFTEGFVLINASVDNIRIHVAKLGFNENEDNKYAGEKHFPSRIRLWVGPEIGSSYVAGLRLGRSTDNAEREMETQRILKSNFGKLRAPKLKAMARTAARTRVRNWRWDQDADGNAAVFEASLCDTTTGVEVAAWEEADGGGGGPGNSFRRRYGGANRAFTKSGGWVVAGEECGGVGWRLRKEMEGKVLKWRIGCEIWVSYWPNHVRSSYFETRCVEWCHEVDLPLILNGD